jgi:arylsulfatase A
VHAPRQASPRFMAEGKTVEQAQVEEVDWSVGQILQTIREEGLAENTLVLFTSDNGPAGGLSAGPLRGRKGSAFEGGHREPTIAWWPGAIPARTSCNELITAMDLHPTLAGLAGTRVPADRTIDGKDIAALLLGEPGAATPHDRFFYQQGGQLAAVRAGDWKLFAKGELYNLKNDLGEKSNVAASHPDKVKELHAMLTDFAAEIRAHARPVGLAPNSRTLVPRPGVEGDQGFLPTLSLKGKQL